MRLNSAVLGSVLINRLRLSFLLLALSRVELNICGPDAWNWLMALWMVVCPRLSVAEGPTNYYRLEVVQSELSSARERQILVVAVV